VRRFETSPDSLPGFVAVSVRDSWTMLVVAAYLVGFVLNAVAIWLLPLYLAQATVAMSLPVSAYASGRLDETLDRRHWGAVGSVTLGLVLLSAGAGEPGDVVTTTRFAAFVWAGLVVLALVSVVTVPVRPVSGATLGVLGGLGYAGSAISVRGVGPPLEAAVVASAAAVPAYGVVAFWLYSLGMRRAAVSSATAALIVLQTFVPAAVGVAFLGDTVRAGWWPGVVAGLLLATTGAIVLSPRSPGSAASASSPDPARRPPPAPRRSS
jgi:drug/metabolite transporter (DMT)-like permease